MELKTLMVKGRVKGFLNKNPLLREFIFHLGCLFQSISAASQRFKDLLDGPRMHHCNLGSHPLDVWTGVKVEILSH